MKHTHKYIIYSFIIFLLSCTNVYASCTEAELNKFNKVKNDYTVTYEINKETKTYDLYFKAPLPENFYYQIYADTKLNCTELEDKMVKCVNLPPDDYEILIVGVTRECNDILKTINLELPEYNSFADDPLCRGIEEFILCSPTYDKKITYEEFVSRVNTYKKNHSAENKEETKQDTDEKKDTPKQNKENEFVTKTIDYIKDNLLEIIVVTIFIILLIITIVVTVKSVRKSRRLE